MNAKTFLSLTILVAALAAAPLGAETEPRVGERVGSFEMSWTPASSEQVAERAEAVARALFGAASGHVEVRPRSNPDGTVRRFEVSIPEAPAWWVRYVPAYDELRMIDQEVARDSTPATDVGEPAARDIARSAFMRLAETGAIDERQYDWHGAEIASTWMVNGTVDGVFSERVRTEYRITLRRSINGIEVANAGLRIAVHASGRLAGLRLGGVTVGSRIGSDRVEEPTGAGSWLTRAVASDTLRDRFEREGAPATAGAQIAWARVMYAMPDGAEGGGTFLVEPRYVVSYSLKTPSDGGEVSSRRLILAYSITDPAAPPLDLSPPARDPRPDPEPKPETTE